jgi:hypothetical protein
MQIDNLISPLEERALLPFPASTSVLDGVMGRVETRPPIVGDIGRPSN